MTLKSIAKGYFWLVAISIYLLPNHPDLSYDYLTRYFNSFILIYSIFVVVACIYGRIELGATQIILSLFLLVLTPLNYLSAGYVNVHAVFLISILFLSKIPRENFLTIDDLKYPFYLALIVTIFGLAFYRFDGFRPTTTWIDPNYSGFYIFILFSISRLLKLKFLSMIIVVLGLLTLSRNFVLAIAVYFVVERFGKSKILFKPIKKVGFIGMTLIAVVLLIGLESTFISSESVYAQNDFDRFYNVVDASNNDRLTANVLLRESLSESPINYFFGVDKDFYTENIFRNTPHNSLLMSIVIFGIFFTIIMFFVMHGLFGSILSRFNLPLFCGLLVYQNVLGVGHYGLALVLVFFIMNSSRESLRK